MPDDSKVADVRGGMRRHASNDEAYVPLVQALGTNPACNRSFKLTIGEPILCGSGRASIFGREGGPERSGSVRPDAQALSNSLKRGLSIKIERSS